MGQLLQETQLFLEHLAIVLWLVLYLCDVASQLNHIAMYYIGEAVMNDLTIASYRQQNIRGKYIFVIFVVTCNETFGSGT